MKKKTRPIHLSSFKISLGFTPDCPERCLKSEGGQATFDTSNERNPFTPLQDSFEILQLFFDTFGPPIA
uniref:Uncharacterized protein n=1 Tax=Lepeophtheirus salmonis TaxID=72036 RepID=A0A0K2SZR3_LEPSM